MYFKSLLLGLFLSYYVTASYAQVKPILSIDHNNHDYGKVESASSLLSEFLITNTGSGTLYILRADASKNCIIKANSKKLLPGDTTTLSVNYKPKESGKFNELIRLYSNAADIPYQLSIKGDLKNLEKENNYLTACYSFKTKRKGISPNTQPIVMAPAKVPDTLDPVIPKKTVVESSDPGSSPAIEKPDSLKTIIVNEGELPINEYKINNVVFLIDISGSMRDTNKLPYLKLSIQHMLKTFREIDKVAVVTYADSAKIFIASTYGNEKERIYNEIEKLKARGRTAGTQGVRLAHQVATENYIPGGNNQIILATDGIFKLSPAEEKLFDSTDITLTKKITMSVAAFGTDNEPYIPRLQMVAQKSKGNFIRITKREDATNALIDEIKFNSKK